MAVLQLLALWLIQPAWCYDVLAPVAARIRSDCAQGMAQEDGEKCEEAVDIYKSLRRLQGRFDRATFEGSGKLAQASAMLEKVEALDPRVTALDWREMSEAVSDARTKLDVVSKFVPVLEKEEAEFARVFQGFYSEKDAVNVEYYFQRAKNAGELARDYGVESQLRPMLDRLQSRFSSLNEERIKWLSAGFVERSREADDYEQKLKELRRSIEAAGPDASTKERWLLSRRLEDLGKEGDALYDRSRQLLVGTDNAGVIPGGVEQRETANGYVDRMEAMIHDYADLREKLGLRASPPPGVGGIGTHTQAFSSFNPALSPRVDETPLAVAAGGISPILRESTEAPGKDFIVKLAMTSSLQASGQPQASLAEDPGYLTQLRNRFSSTHDVGLSQEAAKIAFKQEGPTCSPAVQLQVLCLAGRADCSPEHRLEEVRKLTREAVQKRMAWGTSVDDIGSFDGIPGLYEGSLLPEHGIPVKKVEHASDDQFLNDLKAGHVAVLGVNSAILWTGQAPQDAAKTDHSIMVTGAKVSDSTGDVLCIYVNDSGSKDNNARCVPTQQFLQAWPSKKYVLPRL